MNEKTNSTIITETTATTTGATATDSKRLESLKPTKPTVKKDAIKKVKAEVVSGQTSIIPHKTDAVILAEKKRLNESTEYIRKEIKTVASSFCRIGFKLFEVKSKELYKAHGFKNISEYGENVLGFKKSSTANYIAICERFSVIKNGKPTAQLNDSFASFGYGQLSVMLSLPESKVNEVDPSMTVKEIRSLKGDSSDNESSASADVLDADGKKIDYPEPSVVAFNRVLTNENIVILYKILRDNIGKEICVEIG